MVRTRWMLMGSDESGEARRYIIDISYGGLAMVLLLCSLGYSGYGVGELPPRR